MERINPDAIMNSLNFVLLTHRHGDHFDPELMKRYPHLIWIVPDHLADEVKTHVRPNMMVVKDGDVIRRGEIVIHAFSSLHYDAGTNLGVDETGYFVEANGKRLMMPGDVREYNAARYPAFEGITHFFSHVWLGRKNALNWPCGEYPFGCRIRAESYPQPTPPETGNFSVDFRTCASLCGGFFYPVTREKQLNRPESFQRFFGGDGAWPQERITNYE